MKYLLDTHALIWAALEEDVLSPIVRELITKRDEIVVSTISFWVISRDTRQGKLALSDTELERIPAYVHEMGFTVIDVTASDTISFQHLPVKNEHKNPFERMLIWQAITKDLTFISKDSWLSLYELDGLRHIW